MLTIGRIDYINNLPLFVPFLDSSTTFNGKIIHGSPTEINTKLRVKEVDVALISSIEFLSNQDKYLLYPSLGVAAREEVMSIKFFIRKGLHANQPKKVGITPESATSAQLLKVLNKEFWGMPLEYAVMNSSNHIKDFDAFLLIGDKALLTQNCEAYHTLDLATEWYQATGLGMVFAVFAVRKEVYQTKPNEVESFFERVAIAKHLALKHPKQVLFQAQQRCQLPVSVLERYFQILRYDLQDLEIEGLKKYAHFCGISYTPTLFGPIYVR